MLIIFLSHFCKVFLKCHVRGAVQAENIPGALADNAGKGNMTAKGTDNAKHHYCSLCVLRNRSILF